MEGKNPPLQSPLSIKENIQHLIPGKKVNQNYNQ